MCFLIFRVLGKKLRGTPIIPVSEGRSGIPLFKGGAQKPPFLQKTFHTLKKGFSVFPHVSQKGGRRAPYSQESGKHGGGAPDPRGRVPMENWIEQTR